MSQLVKINEITIEQITYKQQAVVTFQQIADVHGISAKNVHESFRRNRERFTEDKHYFRLDFIEASQLPSSVGASPNGLTLFTEKGYLLLAKPLRDDKAWEVQERMIDEYFALRTTQLHAPLPPVAPVLPSPADQLALCQATYAFLEDLGCATDRDRLMIADFARNGLRTAQGLLAAPGTSPTAHGFSVAERVAQLGYHLTRVQQAALYSPLGKRLAAEYRSRTGKDPQKELRYVDGASRPVSWCAAEDASWVDPLVQSFMVSLQIGAVSP
jgi:hypothetical protein